MKWWSLGGAIACEVTATLSLRAATDDPVWYVLVVAGYCASFAFLARALRLMPVGVAYGMLRIFKAADPGGIPRLEDVALNGWVMAFTVGVAAVVGIATGLVPALETPFGSIVTAQLA